MGSDLESTVILIDRMRQGDLGARDALLERYLPVLRRWAHGRLPPHARGLADTEDLVQVTLVRALDRLPAFEPRREGAFLAYLRRILLNALRDEIRRSRRRPVGTEQAERVVDPGPSPIEGLIGRESLERYEAALARLAPEQQEAVILRIEMGYTHQQIADALGRPSADAARMTIARALARLAEVLDE
jgi:RNA polymerase sigma-70 factor (ECF subfamily)